MIDPGWLGVLLLAFAPLPQLRRLFKTGQGKDVAIGTYVCVVAGVICYLIHAIIIKDTVFITSNAVNLALNSTILIMLLKRKPCLLKNNSLPR